MTNKLQKTKHKIFQEKIRKDFDAPKTDFLKSELWNTQAKERA